jgi:RNA polymerase sigma-70 factor (sigma-E family)
MSAPQIPEAREVQEDRDADRAVTELYVLHYRSLVRAAALLVPDLATAEEIVQDSFAAMHSAWHRLPGTDAPLSYLHRSVVDRSRALRHHVVAGKLGPKRAPGRSDSGQEAGIKLECSAFVSALRALPARQREVLVLRYLAGLPDNQIASATGISKGAVESHCALAMAALQAELST